MTTVIVKRSSLNRSCFRQAICTGIELHRFDIVIHLLSTYSDTFGSATEECTKDWLKTALKARDEKTMRILQVFPTQAGTKIFYTAFESSCRLNAPKISRVFFEEERLRLNELCLRKYPVLSAMDGKSGHVLQELLDMGANPDGPSYLDSAKRPLRLAMVRGHIEFACQLLQSGANPHLSTGPIYGSSAERLFEHKRFINLVIEAGKKCKRSTEFKGEEHFADSVDDEAEHNDNDAL
jgi:hypothetical protein